MRSSTNRSFDYDQTAPSTPQMIYNYGNVALHQQQHAQAVHQVSHSSPPQQHTWALPQSHDTYYQTQGQPGMIARNDSRHMLAKAHMTAMHSPASSSASFSEDVSAPEALTTTDYFPTVSTGSWGHKICEDLEAFPTLDPDMNDYGQELMGHDEDTPIIDLRQSYGMEQREPGHPSTAHQDSSRRMSESSFAMSNSSGVLPEASIYEDMGSSEAVSYASDCEAWNNLEPVPNLLSPLGSPCRPQYDHVVRSGSRTRASPAPHNNVRSSPYTLESRRFKRWSTGHAPTSTPAAHRGLAQVQDRFAPFGPRLNPHHSLPAYSTNSFGNFGVHAQNVLYSQPQSLQSSNSNIFTHQEPYHLEVPRPLPSQGLFRLLQSNADRHGGCASHFADLSDPPDLYSSLHEEPSDPPESDMNPSDPDLVPHEQDLRFAGDLYTPRWVRGHGNKREGWCGLCKPGRWLVLKNSAFWYDKSFTHGVSAATGAAFQGPQDTRRTEGNLDVWEGLCGSCGEWIALVSSKKKGTTWFRHAYKCHTHPKVKDGPKRRRETHTVRARTVSAASTTPSSFPSKAEIQADAKPNRHSTPIPNTALQQFGIPSSGSPLPRFTPTPTPSTPFPATSSTSQPASSASYSTASAYPTPTSATAAYPLLSDFDAYPNSEPVMSMFTSPLQSGGTFHPSLVVSEPELVGVPRPTTLNSLASML